jgi:hypothetical protein
MKLDSFVDKIALSQSGPLVALGERDGDSRALPSTNWHHRCPGRDWGAGGVPLVQPRWYVARHQQQQSVISLFTIAQQKSRPHSAGGLRSSCAPPVSLRAPRRTAPRRRRRPARRSACAGRPRVPHPPTGRTGRRSPSWSHRRRRTW